MPREQEGIVKELDVERGRVKVSFPDRDVVSPWLSVLQSNTYRNKAHGLPDVDELVLCLLAEGESHGWVLGAVYTATNVPPATTEDERGMQFEDGTIIKYDRSAHLLTIQIGGGGNAAVTCAEFLLDGQLQVKGAAAALSRDDRVQSVLSALKSAIGGGVTIPNDGGASLKSTIMAALASWPSATAADEAFSD